jgi:DNA-binding transcriptional MerR regulator/methylmalonyl-CoA mutase cobalamin-binding subunit
MYTIRTAAARAGVSTEAIRAWERRYGVVSPRRAENGYRVYDDEAIARLVAMRRLIDSGWSARLAAQHVVDNGPAIDRSLVADAANRAGTQEATDELVAAFVTAAADMDGTALDAVLDEMFARGTFERVIEDLVYPALRTVGEHWQSGELSVAAEHAASHAVMRRLSAMFDAAGRARARGPRLVIGMPPGARHEAGALGFAVAARRAGYAVTYVGADLPALDWVRAARAADAIVMGVVVKPDVAAALAVSDAVRERHPAVQIVLGGPQAPAAEGHLRLPLATADALSALSNLVDAAV